MIITLKDGSKERICREQDQSIDIAYDISEGLARAACAGEVNGEVVDLRTVLDRGLRTEHSDSQRTRQGLAVLRHTASHVLAQAVQELVSGSQACYRTFY